MRTDLRICTNSEDYTFRKVVRNRKNLSGFLNGDNQKSFLRTVSTESARHCRFTIADPEYASRLISSEKQALTQQIEQYKDDHDEIKDQFLEAALQSIEDPVQKGDDPAFHLQEFHKKDAVTFYQDHLGRLLFLDPLSNKMLKMHFEGLENAPETLKFACLKIRTLVVDQNERNRHLSVGHLPSGAEVGLVLADLRGIVSDEVLEAFASEMGERLRCDDVFEPEPPGPEILELTDEDFPEFGSGVPVQWRKSSAWGGLVESQSAPVRKSLASDSEFPSFGQVTARRPASCVWGAGMKT
jgi:hypothetical protein